MAASVQFRPQNRDLGMIVREVDEDLAIFLGMRNGDNERNDHVLIENSNAFDDSTSAEPKPDSLLIPNNLQPETAQIAVDDNLLNLETDRSDYDWLLKQRDTSSLSSVEAAGQDSAVNKSEISNCEGVSLNSELVKPSEESAPTSSALLPATSNNLNSSAAATRRPLSSRGRKPASGAATPTGRPSLPAKSKPSRASTPTSRATSAKPMSDQVRSSTPSRASSRSSTPASRPTTLASSKSGSRSATPTRKPATPSTTSSVSASDGSSLGRKTVLKNPAPTSGSTQTVKSRPTKSSEMLSLSHNAPQNLKTSLPKRPASASRGRPSAPATQLSSSNGKPRQQSSSPAKVRAPNATAHHKLGNMMLSRSRGYSHGGDDDVNPVLMGSKMVERVVNMRKLAPPKQDERISLDKPRRSSQENSGFGRSLSKRSLDMAIRHMDIQRSIPDNLRPVATAALSSNQSSSPQSSTVGVSDSPLTSGSDSSKSSNCVNSYFLNRRRMHD